jgi:imidazoleglycerol-phosphate dehydratase
MTLVTRETNETRIRVELTADAAATTVRTTIPFLDHMLATLARYAGVGLVIEADGDLRHHIIEDVAICAGKAFAAYAPPHCARYGDRLVPMDDALVQCAIDIGGRPYYAGPLPSKLYDHWMRSFADNAGATLHLRVIRGHDRHHIVEGAFKALGLALRAALRSGDEVFSTKGTASIEVTP